MQGRCVSAWIVLIGDGVRGRVPSEQLSPKDGKQGSSADGTGSRRTE